MVSGSAGYGAGSRARTCTLLLMLRAAQGNKTIGQVGNLSGYYNGKF